jgi:hypothetical protein
MVAQFRVARSAPMSRFLLAAAALGSPAVSETCLITYPQFYAAIAHADMATCPTSLEGPSRFCRLVNGANGQAHVFVFTVEGAQCLVGYREFAPEALRPAES